jgi:hypothetical protein
MNTLLENEHPLVTPNFIGTDEEKIAVLAYWAEMIRHLRSLNAIVISHENKLAIMDQLNKELDIVCQEVNNATSHSVTNPDGSTEQSTMPTGAEVPVVAPVVNLAEPEVRESVKESVDPYAKFNQKALTPAEAMQRLAGTYYSNKSKKSTK